MTLEEQDRSVWDGAAIAEAEALLRGAARDRVGPYQLQAAIASVHAAARSAGETDWPAIARLYEQLADVVPSPVVELNSSVAVAMADGPAVGLARLDALEDKLPDYYLFHATRADLLRRSGRDVGGGGELPRRARARRHRRGAALPRTAAGRDRVVGSAR